MAQVYEVTRGMSRDIPIRVTTKINGQAFNFLDTDSLACKVSTGDDQAPLATPAVQLQGFAPTNGLLIRVVNADTSTLEPGDYELLVSFTRGGRTVPVTPGAVLRVLPAPGTGTPRITLITHDDILSFVTNIDAVQRLGQDQTGFREQRADASDEFMKWIEDRYKPRPGFALRRLTSFNRRQGYDLQEWVRTAPTKAQVRAALDAGGLIMDEVAKEIVVRLATVIILGDEVTIDQRGGYGTLASANRDRANLLMRGYEAHLDLSVPLDGIADVIIKEDVIFLT